MKHLFKCMMDNLFETIISLLTLIFLIWCIWPAFGCEGDIVRGLVRLACIG